MKLQYTISSLLLALLGLAGKTIGLSASISSITTPTTPSSAACSYITNGAGFASVICLPTTGRPSGFVSTDHTILPTGYPVVPSGLHSGSVIPSMETSVVETATTQTLNYTISPVTSYYTTTNDLIVPGHTETETVVHLSTEFATTTMTENWGDHHDTRTFVYIQGYSLIDDYTTTVTFPSSTISGSGVLSTVTVTSSELVSPSFSHTTDAFPASSPEKRGATWPPLQNGTVVPTSTTSSDIPSETVSIPWSLTATPSGHNTAWPTSFSGNSTNTTLAPFPSSKKDGFSAQSVAGESTSSFLLITVTNTLSITPSTLITPPNGHHTTSTSSTHSKDSSLNKSASVWPSLSPVLNQTTHTNTQDTSSVGHPSTTSYQNTSLVSITTSLASTISTLGIGKTAQPAEAATTTISHAAASTSAPISGGSKPYAGFVQMVLAMLAGAILV